MNTNTTGIGLAIALVSSLGMVTACGSGAKQSGGEQANARPAASAESPVQITDAARNEAHQIFSTRCAVCHGQDGRGDGPGGAALNPKPRNYHDPAWQDSVTDKEIETAILYGGAAVGRSPMMVANPDLQSKPEVVAALREMVRQFGKEK